MRSGITRLRARRVPALLSLSLFVAGIMVVVAILDAVSLKLARNPVPVDMLWPARGVVLALCLLARGTRVRAVLVAAMIGGVIGRMVIGMTLPIALMGAAICVADAALALCLLSLLVGDDPDFRDWRQLMKFLAVACAAASVIAIPESFVPGPAIGNSFLLAWMAATLSTTLSYAIFTPSLVLLATMHSAGYAQSMARRVVLANCGMLVLLVFVFSQSMFPGGFLVPIGLLAVVMSAEVEGVSVALLTTSIVSIGFTAMGNGPWQMVPGSTTLRVSVVQMFLAAMTFGLVPTAAAMSERRKLREGLELALAEQRDIAAALKRSSAALSESEELYRLLAENASDIVIKTSLSGRILYVSPAIERILGYAPAHLVGTDLADLVFEEDKEKFIESLKGAIIGAQSARLEYRARHRNGALCWLESAPQVGYDGAGEPIGIIDIARDVSARRAMEDALVEARRRAELAAEAKAEFLANMSHELKTPLTSAIGFADALNDYCGLDGRARRFADGVRTASLALLATVNDILDYSRLERGLLTYESRPFPLRRHLEETLSLFAVQAKEKGIGLAFECPASLDCVEVFTDPDRLRQVLINLVGNAVKFTEEGAVKLAVGASEGPAGGAVLCFNVSDTGAGIGPDRLSALFQRFSQLETGTKRRHGGSGLGLAISKGIVEGLGGDIGVESAPGKGSRFWFEIPAEILAGVEAGPIARTG